MLNPPTSQQERSAASLKRQAKRNHHPGPNFDYKKRGGIAEVRKCKFCGAELPKKRQFRDYCNSFCMVKEFHKCYCKEDK